MVNTFRMVPKWLSSDVLAPCTESLWIFAHFIVACGTEDLLCLWWLAWRHPTFLCAECVSWSFDGVLHFYLPFSLELSGPCDALSWPTRFQFTWPFWCRERYQSKIASYYFLWHRNYDNLSKLSHMARKCDNFLCNFWWWLLWENSKLYCFNFNQFY